MGAGVRLGVIVRSRTGVHVTVGHGHISAHICANPVSKVLLVHWVLISIVLSGAWEINILVFDIRLYAETKFGVFPSII